MSKFIGAAVLFLATAGIAAASIGPSFVRVPVAAPEIDPASAVSGLTLLLGGLAIFRGRRARK